ncbi:peptidase M19 [Rhizosphaericola mali]|uniref:Peptidase M19 n=2 Tax=Rhizosphaericola mali TaxID=2545455 RepID=A0A5P2GGK1_9BACT|nr:peptidase M19 [Rhizosphaericola mali]
MFQSSTFIKRRRFLKSIGMASSALFLNPLLGWTTETQEDKVKRIVAKTIGIDTHNHMDLPFDMNEFKNKNYELAAELQDSGLTAIGMTFCVDRPQLTKEGEAFDRFILELDEMDDLLHANNISRALSYGDIKKARKENKQVVIQSVEGAHFTEGKIERIKIAYDLGLRQLGLMHDGQSTPPIGDIYTDKPQYGGLTQLGIDIIKECNRIGILLDLAHCNNDAINKAIEVSSKPMVISHTGLNTRLGKNERLAKMMFPRLISPEQARLFAKAGGVIGVWTHLADTPLEFAENVKAMVGTIGVDHVCIGTDTTMAPSADNNNRFQNKTNQSWKGEKIGFYYTVVDALLQSGFSESDINKIGGGNFFRVFENATNV